MRNWTRCWAVNSPRLPLAPLLLVLGGVTLALALVSLRLGAVPLGWREIAQALAGEAPQRAELVIWSIRLPRIAAALLAGAALAVAGAGFQILFRNPLVSPDILGVSSGAALGAVAGIFLALPAAAIQGAGFAGGLAAVALVALMARILRGPAADRGLSLVLTGIVISALAGALVSLLKLMADPYQQLPAITFWLLGSLAAAGWRELALAAPPILAGLALVLALRWRIELLALPEDEARSLGLATGPLRAAVILAATLMVASVVALAGVIGWIGLVVPHMARGLAGASAPRMLPVAALAGAGFMLAVDTACRTIAPVEVPLGVLTAIIGAPLFLWLLARRGAGWA